jgi:hypothetical protein
MDRLKKPIRTCAPPEFGHTKIKQFGATATLLAKLERFGQRGFDDTE